MKEEIKNILIVIFFLIMQIFILIGNINNEDYDVFFWFCNHIPMLFAISFYFNNHNMTKGLINIGFLAQLVWGLDFLSKLIFNTYIFNLTEYVFEKNSLWILLPISIHLFSTNVALYLTRKEEPNQKTLEYSMIYVIILYIVTLIFTNPANNINWIYKIEANINYSNTLYTIFWPIITLVFIILPTQKIQELIYLKTLTKNNNKKYKKI